MSELTISKLPSTVNVSWTYSRTVSLFCSCLSNFKKKEADDRCCKVCDNRNKFVLLTLHNITSRQIQLLASC